MTGTYADKDVWFITGAGRGLRVDFATAALTAGHVVADTGWDTDAVAKRLGLWVSQTACRLLSWT